MYVNFDKIVPIEHITMWKKFHIFNSIRSWANSKWILLGIVNSSTPSSCYILHTSTISDTN